MVLGVDGGLHIVADDAGAFAAGRHCASIWIGQRDLPIWRDLNGDLHLSQVLHLLLKAGELVLKPSRFGFGNLTLFDLLHKTRYRTLRVVLVPIVHSLEP